MNGTLVKRDGRRYKGTYDLEDDGVLFTGTPTSRFSPDIKYPALTIWVPFANIDEIVCES